MNVFLHLLLNALLILGWFIPLGISGILIIFDTQGPHPWIERSIRGLALFAAILAVLVSEAEGITFSKAMVTMLEVRGFGGILIKLAWIAGIGAAGAALSWYMTKELKYSPNVQIRIMIFVSMVIFMELIEIYAKSVSRNGFSIGAGAIPEAAFITGLLLYIVLRFNPDGVRVIRGGMRGSSPTPPEQHRKSIAPPRDDDHYPNIFGER